ncbi:MAG: HIT domain-containing protein [Fimbriimonadaceae bacterium]
MPERLAAPWRFEYVSTADAQAQGGCIFVDLPAQSDDRKNLILYRGRTAFVMLNAFPYTSGHLMVAPYKHTARMDELDDAELLEINQLIARAMRWIEAVYKPEGFNVGVNLGQAGGAGIPTHLHWHIVPRWRGDTNFMTTVADVRVIPQSLESAYDHLKAAVDADDPGA